MKDTPSQVLIDSMITMSERLVEAGKPNSSALLAEVLARKINVSELPADSIWIAHLEDGDQQ